ncbi:DUF4357 domain-containing protein, partial [Autumnicola edwardsiae]
KNWLSFRQNLVDDGIIQNINNNLTFVQDYLFSSPSAAAAIVMGRSANGLTEWKLADGRILKAVESSENKL